MIQIKQHNLARWHGVGSGNAPNVTCSIGHLNCTGFIFPKYKTYEYKTNFRTVQS